MILKLFSKTGLKDLFKEASLKSNVSEVSDNSKRIYALEDEYIIVPQLNLASIVKKWIITNTIMNYLEI